MRTKLLILGVFFLTLQSCWSTREETDREDCIPTFERNFGFQPPIEIEEIKMKYFGFRDGTAHWMCFTYQPEVFEQIIDNDLDLVAAYSYDPEYDRITSSFAKDNPNRPDWFVVPSANIESIQYKKDYLDHTFSEYYLWLDKQNDLVYLHTHYFD